MDLLKQTYRNGLMVHKWIITFLETAPLYTVFSFLWGWGKLSPVAANLLIPVSTRMFPPLDHHISTPPLNQIKNSI